MPGSRRYCFTFYPDTNVMVEDYKRWWTFDVRQQTNLKYRCTYVIVNPELCPTTGAFHFQGYAEFNGSVGYSTAQDILKIGKSKMIACDGDPDANIHYCSKPHEGCTCQHCETARASPYCFATTGNHIEQGSVSKGQGNRSDWDSLKERIQQGASYRDLVQSHTALIGRYSRGVKEIYNHLQEVKVEDPQIVLRPWQDQVLKLIDQGFKKRQIIWIWSRESATGKSTFVDYLNYKYGLNSVLQGLFQWNDLANLYNNHKVVVFNIPRQDQIHNTHLAVLERCSDGGAFASGKYEGAQKVMKSVIIVTSNSPPPEAQMPKRCISFCLDDPNVAPSVSHPTPALMAQVRHQLEQMPLPSEDPHRSLQSDLDRAHH